MKPKSVQQHFYHSRQPPSRPSRVWLLLGFLAICMVAAEIRAQDFGKAKKFDGRVDKPAFDEHVTSIRATHINSDQLKAILARRIRALEISGDELLTAEDYDAIVQQQGLERLVLAAPAKAGPNFFSKVLSIKGLKQLEVLNPAPSCQAFARISPCNSTIAFLALSGVASDSLDWNGLLKALPDLVWFDFVGRVDKRLFSNLKLLPKLVQLELLNSNNGESYRPTADDLKAHYDSITLARDFTISEEVAARLIQSSKAVELLYVEIEEFSGEVHIKQPTMERLLIEGCKWHDDPLLSLFFCTTLQCVEMHPGRFGFSIGERPRLLSQTLLRSIVKSCTRLRELQATLCSDVGFDDLNALFDVAPLERLDLTFCECLDDKGMTSLSKCSTLRTLRLTNLTGVSDHGYQALSQLSQLEELSLVVAPNLGCNGCRKIAEIRQLRTLSISSSQQLTDSALAHLCGIRTLEHFEIAKCTELSISGIRRVTKLQGLTSLALRDVNLNGAGLAYLTSLERLSRLDISGNQGVDDSCVETLGRLRALSVLTVYRTLLSTQGVRRLVTQLPGLVVNHTPE